MLEQDRRNKDRQRKAGMSNFNELLDAFVDLGRAWADRHTKRPAQPAVVLESEYIKMYETLKRVAVRRDIYLETLRAFNGQVLDWGKVNAMLDRLGAERGVKFTD
jgi:hypothetical protein